MFSMELEDLIVPSTAITQEGRCSCSSPCPKPFIPFSPYNISLTGPNSYPFKNSCHRCSCLAWLQYHPVYPHAYVTAPNALPSIKIALRCQVSHWSNTSIWVSSWRIHPWSQEMREHGARMLGLSFLLIPAGMFAELALGGSLKDFYPDSLSEILTSSSFLMWGQNNPPQQVLPAAAVWSSHGVSSAHAPWYFLDWLLLSTELPRETERDRSM